MPKFLCYVFILDVHKMLSHDATNEQSQATNCNPLLMSESIETRLKLETIKKDPTIVRPSTDEMTPTTDLFCSYYLAGQR